MASKSVPDSSPIVATADAPTDLTSAIVDIASHVQYKLMGMMLIIFLFINSDVFVNRALSAFSGAVDFKCATSYGVILQGIFLVIAMIVMDVAIKQKII